MMRWLTNNLGLKLLALALAVALWFYVQGELEQPEGGPMMGVERETLGAVMVPVRPRLIGQPAPGFRIRYEQVRCEPPSLAVAGRPQWLLHLHALWTEPIDLRGVQRTVVREMPVALGGGASGGGMREVWVTVTVPVEPERLSVTP